MAKKKTTTPDLDIEVTEEQRFEAKLILMEDVTVVWLMMGLLYPLRRVDEELARKARVTFAEVLKRWVPDEVAEKAAGHMIGEDDVDNIATTDEAEVEDMAILLAAAEKYPEEFAALLATPEES